MSESVLNVQVDLGPRSYEITIGSDRLSQFANAVAGWIPAPTSGVKKVAIVTDRNLAQSHLVPVATSLRSAGWEVCEIVLKPGEASKSFTVMQEMFDQLVDFKADRGTLLVALGGGVVGDAAGFVAATYTRGIPFIQVPTTLLAQVDSSVGGKVAVNHTRAKNLIGAFYQPRGVFVDTATLSTLPVRDYRSGMAEVVKYGMILDAEFFEYLEQHLSELNERDPEVLRYVVSRSCRLKADVVEADEEERTGLRAVLNYGHTFAHAYEALCGYGELMHGEAVSIGMINASRLAERLGMVDAELTKRQIALLSGLSLPVELPEGSDLNSDAILDRMKLDKKVLAGKLRFVLPTRMGHCEMVSDVAEEDVRAVL
ncbi:3-dehydroquinate synthase [Polystyrenella longa]|uniref:3-dehydroquinate synthase n=1 Tax=Polystyrenella longa TaxID=2528007 RepID=A0A518CSE1_9PLAN|nr:3-dehydroquinate synthase [Polystyrenella longa]QDU82152.1 3-dehydroquinate synthase [Polystyrenella longa]